MTSKQQEVVLEHALVATNSTRQKSRVRVAGIAVSNDKVLQTRVIAYADTQRYRLGVNYQLLYINAPRCPFHNNHQDGLMNVTERNEEVCLFPTHVFHLAGTG